MTDLNFYSDWSI